MLRTTLRNLWSHKRRMVATSLAVLLGVAFMAGTLVLTATINAVFDDLFAGLSEDVDTVVRGPELFEAPQGGGSVRDHLDVSTVDRVAAIDGVAVAEGSIATETLTLLDEDGDVVGGFGPPTIVGSWETDEVMNPYTVVEGRAPEAPGEAVIDRAGADNGPFELGDTLPLVTPDGREQLTVVGITRFGNADSAGGSIFIGTTLAEAQRLAGQPGRIEMVLARAEPGVSSAELTRRVADAGLGQVDVLTGAELADEQASELKEGFGFLSTALLVFAAIALFVGWFIISNTFGILVAQRTRELALVRAIGASRSQVLGSVLLEAVVIGVVSAVLGFLGGVALAAAAIAALREFGLDLPSAGLVIRPQVALITVGVGLLITTLAAIIPAIRATRVPPLAAMRDVAIDQSNRSRWRMVLGALAALVGAVLIAPVFGTEIEGSSELAPVGAGMGLIVLAVLLLGPVFSRPLSRLVGFLVQGLIAVQELLATPFRALRRRDPDARSADARPVLGTLARENAMRNPGRTASTASALIIGVTLVGFITVFAASAQRSIRDMMDRGFAGDFIVQPANQAGGFTGVTPDLTEAMRSVEGTAAVSGLAFMDGTIELPSGESDYDFLGGVEPETFEQVFEIRMVEGSLQDLDDGEMIVDQGAAEDNDLEVGDTVSFTSRTGQQGSYRIVGLSDDPQLLGWWTITRADAALLTTQPTDAMIAVALEPGADADEVRAELEEQVDLYPTMKLLDRDEFTQSFVNLISTLLNVIYALLAVSVVIALIGIANTLSLSIHERTRELGLLRAMGMTRRQLRASVRWEAVIVALMGTGIGLLLGLALSWVLVRALASEGLESFDVPVGGMTVVVVFGAVLGIVASLRPAYRASKLNVLDAIAQE